MEQSPPCFTAAILSPRQLYAFYRKGCPHLLQLTVSSAQIQNALTMQVQHQNQRPTRLRIAISLLCFSILSACSIIDPNRILTRTHAPLLTPAVPVPTEDDNWRRDALDFVWTTINERYYDPKLNGVNWAAVRALYEPRLMAAKSDDEYWDLLDKMTGELRDSHTRIHPPKMVQQQRAGEAHGLGLGFIEIDGGLVVNSVHPQSDAYWAGARVGMGIKSINGEDAMTVYRRLVAESRDTSTPWARARGAIGRMNRGDVDTTVKMTFSRHASPAASEDINVTMKRRKFNAGSNFIQRVLPSGYGYIHFSNFVGALRGDIIAAIDRMKDTPGMVIDLRNNGGGSSAMTTALLNRFFSTPQQGMKQSTRTGRPIQLFFVDTMKMQAELAGSGSAAYTKPVVVLTNESSASASEIFAITMQENKRATLIGERTCGCLLAYLGMTDVPGGAQMAYSEIGYTARNGSRIEGEGVKPDIEIKHSREDILLNRDRVLERAVAFLHSASTTSK
jgi:carboxyl-terminal processing protease